MRGILIAHLLLITDSLSAQDPAAPVTVRPRMTYGGRCPVGMTARQKGAGQTLWTIALEDQGDSGRAAEAKRGGLGVAVELKAEKDHGMREATFEVSYLPPGMRVLPIDQAGLAHGAELAKKTFSLSASDDGTLKLMGDLLVGRAATIERVHLVSLTYTDGAHWQADGAGSCVVEPSRVVLVDAR